MPRPTGRADAREEVRMDNRIAILGIIVENQEAGNLVQEHLHSCAGYIVGRMGIPYREKGVSIISVALDAPADVINTLAGKIGSLSGVSARAIYSRN